MTAREKLARVLHDGMPAHVAGWDGITDEDRAFYRRLADVVIREWLPTVRSQAWEAGWDMHHAYLESRGELAEQVRAKVYAEIADRLAAWEFPAGSDALSPVCLLVAELRQRPNA